MSVGQHAYIRVHAHPKRFPAAYVFDWKVLCFLSVFADSAALRFCCNLAF